MEEYCVTAYTMPRVKSLRIRNVGIFKRLDLKFSRGINLLVGGGGVGKSTVLELLAWAGQHGYILTEGASSVDLLAGGGRASGLLQCSGVRSGAEKAELAVEYAPFRYIYEKNKTPMTYGVADIRGLKSLKGFLRELSEKDCLLVELDEIFAFRCRDVKREDVFAVLLKARCQVIGAVSDYNPRGLKLPVRIKQIKL